MYLNEIDRHAAAWLRELFPTATIDERSIADVTISDVAGFRRVHFFAGVGGWERALDLAGVPADLPVWTGSCPCQPFSTAGKRKGEADERHLWPEMRRLVAECMPPIVFGEQVARGPGREWLARVRADLEALGYVVGAADLCAAGVSAPHIRQRIYWGAVRVGNAPGHNERWPRVSGAHGEGEQDRGPGCIDNGWMGDPIQQGPQGQWPGIRGGSDDRRGGQQATETGGAGGVSDSSIGRCRQGCEIDGRGAGRSHAEAERVRSMHGCSVDRLPNADRERRDGVDLLHGSGWFQNPEAAWRRTRGFWSRYDVIPFIDGKARRIESGTLPLVAGLPRGVGYSSDPGFPGYAQNTAEARVMRLHGYGNAIVPQLAAVFIRCFLDAVRSMFGLPANAGEDET